MSNWDKSRRRLGVEPGTPLGFCNTTVIVMHNHSRLSATRPFFLKPAEPPTRLAQRARVVFQDRHLAKIEDAFGAKQFAPSAFALVNAC